MLQIRRAPQADQAGVDDAPATDNWEQSVSGAQNSEPWRNEEVPYYGLMRSIRVGLLAVRARVTSSRPPRTPVGGPGLSRQRSRVTVQCFGLTRGRR